MAKGLVEPVERRLRIGIVGLGTISDQIARSIKDTPGCQLAAGADVRAEARRGFGRDHAVPAFEDVEAMCERGDIDVVWVAIPNHLHCAVTLAALQRGKHVICEKPLAVTMRQCDAIVRAADRAGLLVVQGHSKIFDAPVRAMRSVIDRGDLGAVLRVDSWLFNDWLRRPRIAEELDVAQGGGVVLRQGPHMVDIARYLGGGRVRAVKSSSGRAEPVQGDFAALLEFEGGAAASLSFNGLGYFDNAELTWGIGPSGRQAGLEELRRSRALPRGAIAPEEKYGAAMSTAPARVMPVRTAGLPFFGLTIVHCERGVVRQSPDGVLVYGDGGCETVPVARAPAGAPELHALREALDQHRPVFPDARWGRDTVEVCLGMLASARRGRTVRMRPAARFNEEQEHG